MRAAVLLWRQGSHACLLPMCLSIIPTAPLSPNARYLYVCFLSPHLVFSLLMEAPYLSLVFRVSPPNRFLPSPPPQTRWTFLSDTYFNLFLRPAPSLFFLPQFFLPMAWSHATFTPSSLRRSFLPGSPFFTLLQLASLNLNLCFLCFFLNILSFLAASPPSHSFLPILLPLSLS